jgi:hypothetical protein
MHSKLDLVDSHLPPETSHHRSRFDEEAELVDDLAAFGWLRGVRDRALMLELRHKSGDVTALGYAWLEKTVFKPSEGILLYFSGGMVKITGRNLNAELRQGVRLFAGILRHRVPWIQEFDEPAIIRAEKGATVVERIEVK